MSLKFTLASVQSKLPETLFSNRPFLVIGNRRVSVLALILALSVVLRVGVALYYGDWVPPRQDDNNYSSLALRVAQGHGFSFEEEWYPFTAAGEPTAHWSFLYTAYVAAIYAVAGFRPLLVRLTGALLGGLLLPWLSYRLGRRLFPRRPSVGLVAALLTAGYAYFILFAARIMTETFYIAALLWSLERALALRDRWQVGTLTGWQVEDWKAALTFGASLGLAALLRQAVLPWVVVLFAWLLWSGVGRLAGWQVRRLKPANWLTCKPVTSLLVAGVVMGAFILPFTVRNYVVYGEFLLLNSNAGYAMYSAQHPMHGISFIEHGAAPLPEDLVGQGLNEAQWDKALMRRGVGFVLAEPGRYLLLSASRVLDYFEFWPTDTSLLHNVGRLASFTLYLPFFVAGIWLAAREAWQRAGGVGDFLATPVALALLFMGFYSLLHIFTWAMPRYRLPVDAVAMPFAAVAVAAVYRRATHGGRPSKVGQGTADSGRRTADGSAKLGKGQRSAVGGGEA